MKIKTTLIAAATLAVGAMSSQAQVYSQNIVGYYNLSVPHNGFAQVANQLDVDGVDLLTTVLTNSTLVSDVNGNNNTTVYIWSKASQGYLTLQYFNKSDATNYWGPGNPPGFYDGGGNYTNPPITVGKPFFIQNINNSVSNLTVTLVGSVLKSTNVISVTPGYQMVSLPAPVAQPINYTGVSDVNGNNNDTIYSWNSALQGFYTIQYFNASDATNYWGAGSPAGFYDGGGNYTNFTPNAGQGFFILRITGASTTWTNSFTY